MTVDSSLYQISASLAIALKNFFVPFVPELKMVALDASDGDIATDLNRVRQLAGTNAETLPAALLSRTQMQKTYGEKSRPYRLSALDSNGNSVRFQPVMLTYSLRFYTTTFAESERVLEELFINRTPEASFSYTVTGVSSSFGGTWNVEGTAVTRRATLSTAKEQGFVYGVTCTVQAYASLVVTNGTTPTINTVIAQVFDLDGTVLESKFTVTQSGVTNNV